MSTSPDETRTALGEETFHKPGAGPDDPPPVSEPDVESDDEIAAPDPVENG